jgi:glycosyltransferase involved in cell wall biosynthesis
VTALGVTFVIPVKNGAPWLDEMLTAVFAQDDGRPIEVIAVEDGSGDDSPAILARWVARGLVVLEGPRRGAAAAINTGIRAARHPIICQVDQDVIVQPGWMARLADALADPAVGAAQGWYTTDRRASLWARAQGLDVELRYRRIRGEYLDHVCTGNSAYRKDAVVAIGLFDETFGYGYDNDVSYRLSAAGWRLAFRRDAKSIHRWRETARGYMKQMYGQGYGRIDLVVKHPSKARGDDVSSWPMMAHVPLMLLALVAFVVAGVLAAAGGAWRVPALIGGGVIALLALERLVAGVRAAAYFRNAGPLWFVVAHLLRDVVWLAAVAAWSVRQLRGRARRPTDSM